MKKQFLYFIFFIFLLLQTVAIQADNKTASKPVPVDSTLKIPRYNLSLTIQGKGAAQGVLAERMAQIKLNADLWRVDWLAVTTTNTKNSKSPYPTAEVQTQNGIIEGTVNGRKINYLHPLFWPQDYTLVEAALPVWLDSFYFGLKKNKTEEFSLGILKTNIVAPQILDAAVYQEILYFQNLYQGYVGFGDQGKDDDLIKEFDKNYFTMKFLSTTNYTLKINGVNRLVACKVMGNRYFTFTVLDQYDNPLILALEFFPDRVPDVFERSFKFLKKYFEFEVTQIQF